VLWTVGIAEGTFLVEDSSNHLHHLHVELSPYVLVRLAIRSFEHHVLFSDHKLWLNHGALVRLTDCNRASYRVVEHVTEIRFDDFKFTIFDYVDFVALLALFDNDVTWFYKFFYFHEIFELGNFSGYPAFYVRDLLEEPRHLCVVFYFNFSKEF
jgi:hypothetical protein